MNERYPMRLRRFAQKIRARCTRDFVDGALVGFVFGSLWILLGW